MFPAEGANHPDPERQSEPPGQKSLRQPASDPRYFHQTCKHNQEPFAGSSFGSNGDKPDNRKPLTAAVTWRGAEPCRRRGRKVNRTPLDVKSRLVF
ncbi:hypothetical protein CgunFtcFv8_026081 [Champsocephalus gunnari]|uniref:Uncharacterized protein n=1 Tax=Champsocephalus gunnari TaxID=52237 RepID=A0AAN8CEY0_CHAGU|nr:hypothetical protein CgunFtcFv8_026081 [Champsocephalus gunnari]